MHLALPTVPALRDARSATQGQRQGFIHINHYRKQARFARLRDKRNGQTSAFDDETASRN